VIIRKVEEDNVKLLLLGPKDSGKTRLLEQIKVLYGADYNKEEWEKN
jgi:polynucleotide 5'-kinase involved in rRNA processing